MSKLPEKKSELIRLAIADLEKCEADPNYKIDMSNWHNPYDENGEIEVCRVCLAGSVMAKTFHFEIDKRINAFEVEEGAYEKFIFLDRIRLYRSDNDEIIDRIEGWIDEELSYSENPEIFKKNMLQIADWYEEIEQ